MMDNVQLHVILMNILTKTLNHVKYVKVDVVHVVVVQHAQHVMMDIY